MTVPRRGLLREAWLILALAGAFGGALASVQTGLGDRIEANKRAETLSQVPALVLGAEAARGAAIDIRDDRIEVRPAVGEPQTLALMKTEYVYPELGDRASVSDWVEGGRKSIWESARERVAEILAADAPVLTGVGHADGVLDGL